MRKGARTLNVRSETANIATLKVTRLPASWPSKPINLLRNIDKKVRYDRAVLWQKNALHLCLLSSYLVRSTCEGSHGIGMHKVQ